MRMLDLADSGWLELAQGRPLRRISRNAQFICNLYSITTEQAAIAALFRVVNRYVGNLPPMPGIFPDYPAPAVRNSGGEREMTMMRWRIPPPPRTFACSVLYTPRLSPMRTMAILPAPPKSASICPMN
jgi:hypothetical protein